MSEQKSDPGTETPAGQIAAGGVGGLNLNQELLLDRPGTFIFINRSEAMRGAGILPGDVVVVRRDLVPRAQDVIVAAAQGQFVVRLLGPGDGRTVLMAADGGHTPDYVLSGTDEIFGVVSGVIRKIN